jgi:hypothetical protein
MANETHLSAYRALPGEITKKWQEAQLQKTGSGEAPHVRSTAVGTRNRVGIRLLPGRISLRHTAFHLYGTANLRLSMLLKKFVKAEGKFSIQTA